MMGSRKVSLRGTRLHRRASFIGTFILVLVLLTTGLVGAEEPQPPDEGNATLSSIEPSAKFLELDDDKWNIKITLNGESLKEPAGVYKVQTPLGSNNRIATVCTDMHTSTNYGVIYGVSGIGSCEVAWIAQNYPVTWTGGSSYDYNCDTNPTDCIGSKNGWNWKNLEIAARQFIVWHFADGDGTANGGINATNARIGKKKFPVQDRIDEMIASMPNPCNLNDLEQMPTITLDPANSSAAAGTAQEFTITAMKGDEPIAGKTIDISTSAGTLSTDEVTTDANGQATFTVTKDSEGTADLVVTGNFRAPAGTILVYPDDPTRKQALVALQPFDTDLKAEADAHWYEGNTGSLLVHVFEDTNMNGVQNEGEPDMNISSDQIKLNGGNQENVPSDGTVIYTGLSSGSYEVTWSKASDWVSTTPYPVTVNYEANTDMRAELGFVKNNKALQAVVFLDKNADGEYNGDDEPLEGHQVHLAPAWHGVGSKLTNAEGKAGFYGLDDPQYTLSYMPPEGYIATTDTEKTFSNFSTLKTVYFGIRDMSVDAALVVNAEVNPGVVTGVGEEVEYTVTVENVGTAPADDLVMKLEFPAGVEFVSGSAKLNGSEISVSGSEWALDESLAGGNSHTITFKAKITSVNEENLYKVSFTGTSEGQEIPLDNRSNVPADTDPDDADEAVFYGIVWGNADSSNFIAFEDQKGVNWSDWDYNDFVVGVKIYKGELNGNLAAVKVEYEALARGAAYDHTFIHGLNVHGTGTYNLIIRDAAGNEVSNTTDTFESANGNTYTDFTIFASTRDALPPQAQHDQSTNTNPTQQPGGTVEGYTAELIVVLNDAAANPVSELERLPWDTYIEVEDTGATVHRNVAGISGDTEMVVNQYAVNEPMVGYFLPLAQTFEWNWKWPSERSRIWQAYPDYVNYIKSNYNQNQEWYNNPNPGYLWDSSGLAQTNAMQLMKASQTPALAQASYMGQPTAADLDNDGDMEVIMVKQIFEGTEESGMVEVYDAEGMMNGSEPIWTATTNGGIRAAATAANIDSDDALEVLVGDTMGMMYAWDNDGTPMSGWPVAVSEGYRIIVSPAIGDIDNDGMVDVVVTATDGKLYGFNADATAKEQVTFTLSEPEAELAENGRVYPRWNAASSPVIVDLDQDGGYNDIIVGSATEDELYVLNFSPDYADEMMPFVRWTFLADDAVMSTPAIANIDPNVEGLEIAFGANDGKFYLLDMNGNNLASMDVGLMVKTRPMVVDLDGNGDMEMLVAANAAGIWAWHHDGTPVFAQPQDAEGELVASPMMGDVDTDEMDEIVARDGMSVYSWETNSSMLEGWPKQLANGETISSDPVVVASNGETRVIVGDSSGTVHAMDNNATPQQDDTPQEIVFVPMIMR
jgi:LruC domain-containing protein/uncharacterized repeat protein (TIGR01451 family)